MPKFFNSDIADLAHQLTLSPRRLRMEQIRGIEKLLGLIEIDRTYPFEFVCHAITNYRKRGSKTGASVPGKALISDLVTLAELITRKAAVPLAELDETYKTHQEVADELQVSTKTVRRWRNRGLMGIRVAFEDGVSRLIFCRSTIDRFVLRNQELVARGAAFKQLTASERDRIIERAREIVSRQPKKLHAVARTIAEETGRAVETIRYTLRRYDEAHRETGIFVGREPDAVDERRLAIWRCDEAGETTASIARAYECSEEDIRLILRQVQVQRWKGTPVGFIHNELFDAPNADEIILGAPEPAGSNSVPSSIPKDLPPYLRSLYLIPLLTPGQEADLFRRYNYLKHKVAHALEVLDPDEVPEEPFAAIQDLMSRIDSVKQRIIQANLRLVVSIAKKHVGWSPSFFEVISDGNMSLMRAVEKFDYARGNKFSTYGSWAIMKNYARSIPVQHYYCTRFVTGQEAVLERAADHRAQPAPESDRQRVRELIAKGLGELTERERVIVSGHFGLGKKDGALTLEQLGKRFGVTKERIRQIEQRALARLREVLAPSLVDALSD